MEDTGKESRFNLIIGIVVVVAVVIMITMEISKVNKDNSTSRKGSVSSNK